MQMRLGQCWITFGKKKAQSSPRFVLWSVLFGAGNAASQCAWFFSADRRSPSAPEQD